MPPPLSFPPVDGQPVHFLEAIRAAEARQVVLPDVYYGQLQGLARQKAFSIAGIASYDQLKAVLDDLNGALANGQTFKQWKRNQSVKDLELPLHRLDNIFRTNIQGQYMAGRWEQILRTQASRPYLMYDAINDSRTRPAHRALDGFIRPVNDPIWQRISPLNGYRCRCGLISLTEAQAQARSKDGKGLEKPYDPDTMSPDKGWDTSPQDRMEGIQQAVKSRTEKHQGMLEQTLNIKIEEAAEKSRQFQAVSNCLSLPRSGKVRQLSESVLAEIDAIHDVAQMPRIPIVAFKSGTKGGAYRHYVGGAPIEIKVNTHIVATHQELTLAHEIGHFIDDQAIAGANQFASESSAIMSEWRDAIDNSNAIKAIGVGNPRAGYYLSRPEQWARSYAQYIAVKSKNPVLMAQLDAIRTHDPRYDDWVAHRQWQDDDFAPIMAAMDKIFNKLGWLK